MSFDFNTDNEVINSDNNDNNFNSSLGMGLVMLNERHTSNHNSNIEHSDMVMYQMYELPRQINDMFFRNTEWVLENIS